MSNRDTFILKLMREKGMSLPEAEAFVEDLDIPENTGPAVGQRSSQGRWQAGDTVLVRKGGGTGEHAVADRYSVAAVGENGLTSKQQDAIDTGIPLCPNCQQPENDHIPGCLRDPRGGFTEREQRRVVTKAKLPPIT